MTENEIYAELSRHVAAAAEHLERGHDVEITLTTAYYYRLTAKEYEAE